ncbi:hypothetical protein AK88_05049 [Plasmodium fragile]|uniref:Uncharacterized protein n=1 Tax=Plasmodium fragile TaxID=5857 RepID=A0A0D9QHX7_PLAFR|nr:uncharacterized protein AK88_05049 [Plasmodium fragile]KJP85316.1 hypothetical protein AK88_05049 [Plasmodium fragile]
MWPVLNNINAGRNMVAMCCAHTGYWKIINAIYVPEKCNSLIFDRIYATRVWHAKLMKKKRKQNETGKKRKRKKENKEERKDRKDKAKEKIEKMLHYTTIQDARSYILEASIKIFYIKYPIILNIKEYLNVKSQTLKPEKYPIIPSIQMI